MASDKKMLAMAAESSARMLDKRIDNRTFLLGAVGVRNDGVIVESRNIAAFDAEPKAHAEMRLTRKLTPGSTVWVARTSRKNGSWAMARPCPDCERRMRGIGVVRVVYTIGPDEWGILDLK